MATPAPPPPPTAAATAGGADESGTTPDEVALLRQELSELRTRLDTRRRRGELRATVRGVVAAVLVAVCAFAVVAATVGLWAANTTLNTERWVATVAPLPRDPQVTGAVAQFTTTELFAVLDVEQRLREVLPEQAAFVAGPVTGQLRSTVQRMVGDVIGDERFQAVWIEVNRRAHRRMLAVLNGTSDVVTAGSDRVTIDLLPLINQVLREVNTRLPTLFGKQLALPDLSSGEIPDNLRARVEQELGVSLPENFAQFTFYDGGRVWAAQQAVVVAKRAVAVLVVGAAALLVLALLTSPRRRHTLIHLGIWLAVAAVVVTAVLRAVRTELLERVPAGTYRDGVAAAATTIFGSLRERGDQLLWAGVILALAAYLVGPGRLPVWLRGRLVVAARSGGTWLREVSRTAVAHGPEWTARHLDAVRLAGAIVAAGLALLLSSWGSLLVIAGSLVAFEVGVTAIARHGARRAASVAS
jgi:hypothetical protein